MVLIVAIPIIAFAVSFASTGRSAGANEACKLSIIAATKTKIGSQLATGDTIHLSCPVEKVKVRKRDVSKGKEISWDLLNSVIAKEMYTCYVKTGGGKFNPYPKSMGANSYCLVCSKIDFEFNTTIHGFSLYLAAKRIPGQRMSFYEAVYGKSVDADTLRNLKEKVEAGGDTYPIDQSYAVVWRVATKSAWGAIGAGVAAGAAVGAIIGSIVPTGVTTIVGAAVGAAVGFIGGCIGAIGAWFFSDQKYNSEYVFIPLRGVGSTFGGIFGPNVENAGSSFCEVLIEQN